MALKRTPWRLLVALKGGSWGRTTFTLRWVQQKVGHGLSYPVYGNQSLDGFLSSFGHLYQLVESLHLRTDESCYLGTNPRQSKCRDEGAEGHGSSGVQFLEDVTG